MNLNMTSLGKRVGITFALAYCLMACQSGAAQIRDSYLQKTQPSQVFFDNLCAAVSEQGFTCVQNRHKANAWEFMGNFGSSKILISCTLDYAEGDPAYRIKPIFSTLEIMGEKAAQQEFWAAVIESMQKKHQYVLITEESYKQAEAAYLAQQAEAQRLQAIADEKEKVRLAKIVSVLSTPKSCQSLKAAYIKCVKNALNEKLKTDQDVWGDFQRTEMLIPGSGCQTICNVDMMQRCQKVGFSKFPPAFLYTTTCLATCQACWFN